MKYFYVGMASCAVAIALTQAIAPHPLSGDIAAALAIAAVGWLFARKDPSVRVNLHGVVQGTRVEERDDGRGGRSIDVVLDEQVAKAMRQPASRSVRVLKGDFTPYEPAE